MEITNTEYKSWLVELKSKIRSTQIKAAIAVNSALILFYWDLGKMISEKQTSWGSKFLETLSKDLQNEFPEMKGFSVSNLKFCKLFYNYFSIRSQLENEIANNLIVKLPWGHVKLIIVKIKNIEETSFYVKQTIENNWSRDILDLQIKSKLYERQGKAITNFKNTLPEPFSDLAIQTLKDPYIFDFLSLDTKL
jgi:predicted nuclease of restriction endonuclease-like (RecB) superfamily